MEEGLVYAELFSVDHWNEGTVQNFIENFF